MSFQLILSPLFLWASPPPPFGLMKQHANKNEIFLAGPHLAIMHLIKPFLAITPIL